MASTKTPVMTNKRFGTGGLATKPMTVYTKSVSFPVPTSGGADDYYTGDTIALGTQIPAGCQIIGAAYKVSASQGATLTFAIRMDSQSAFVSAQNLTATTMTPLAIVVANTASGASDAAVNIALAGTTVGTTAATITFTFVIAVTDPAASATTYTI